ncbi:MAG: hypothetical protein JO048_12220 [Methylobacteriaceae bacterium]|nr:hypothetical protein [Methylobacteriaceae bacterium]
MQQAVKSIWTEDLDEELRQLTTLSAVRAPAYPVQENVVRPDFARAAPEPAATKAASLIEAVTQAAETVRVAQERAQRTESEARTLIERTAAELQTTRGEVEALRRRAASAEEQLEAVTARAAERLADADAEIRTLRAEMRLHAERAQLAERRANDQIAEAQGLIKDAGDRVFAAETRALEAREELASLENFIRERFAL